MNKKLLFVCNTVYQVIIVAWLKYKVFKNDYADIVISDHSKGYKDIAKNIEKAGLFDNVFTVDSYEYSWYKTQYKSRYERLFYEFFKSYELKKYLKLKTEYDELFVSNLDGFAVLLFAVLGKSGTQLHLFEDGTATYSKLYERNYNNKKVPESRKLHLIYDTLGYKPVYGNVKSLWVLNPEALLWEPEYEVKKIPSLEIDANFKGIINTIFSYEAITDKYDRKYIFFEESFFADTGYTEDVRLVAKLADIVGKDNIMIKIHPRNPKNRFKELGYKTNENISVPWEVLLLNVDFSDKILITIGSQTIVTPCILFGMHIRSFSLINCINEKPKVLDGPLFDVLMMLYDKYKDNITLCNSIEEIIDLETNNENSSFNPDKIGQ